jgi:threonine/homoserine/homoserine lactone efflux protein
LKIPEKREPIGLRRWIICIGFAVFGLMFLAMAASILIEHVAFVPGTRRYRGPRPWEVIRLESPLVQLISGACLAAAGAYFIYLAYKAIREGRER